MIDCSITVNYLKEKARMTDSCKIDCDDCPLYSYTKRNGYNYCVCFEVNSPEKAIEIIQEWSDEHPIKTYRDDFYEKFPNAHRNESERPQNICRRLLYGYTECTGKSCAACWNEVMPDGND